MPAALPAVRFVAGVDGGGTGTRARLQDRAGTLLGQGEAGPSGLGQGVGQAWRHVRQALDAAFSAAGLAPAMPAHIALGLGLAGAGVPAQRSAFLRADPGYALCVLDNDGVTQLLGAHGGGAGIVVAAGTGSVAAACYADGRTAQAGGWGFPVGDEGSGAWLGLRAMQHAHAVLDGREAPTALSRVIFDQLGSTAPALLAWCAQAGAPQYAHLAPLVFAEAERDDATAQALLQAAADELQRLVHALQAGQPPLPVVASGSVGLRLAALWPPALHERVVPPEGDSADGALHLVRAALASAAPQSR
ncbi:MAG: BadF/BadG/BcrA/BcrD ATPase family protein [Rubrivivax sp.]|nr:BadF/BadG/BcrA/BcrD ATPase family protein [Rubrivivax sp.]